MFPTQHILLGAVFVAVLLIFFPSFGLFGASIIFLTSFLIDVDHYLYYVHKKKNWNLINAYNWFSERTKQILSLPKEKRKVYSEVFFLFHGFEVLLVLLLLGFFISNFFFFILIGFLFHLFLDIFYELSLGFRVQKISLIYNLYKVKRMSS